jgi:hypothetical protein
MSSRHGQKGVISKIVPNEDMPKYYDESSDTWNNIDLIINPHTFPTRKTMGQLLEMGNKTYKIKIKDKPIKNPIIVGKCYYMALRHQVADKLQFRNIGKIDDITHQAISGKSRGGGLRFGHMERDIMLAMGAHKELMYLWDIDRVKISCCEICGIIDQPKYIPCTHNRIIKDSHQYLLICLALLRANGHNIKYYPYSEEYEIVDYDIKSNTEEVKNINDLHFGYTYILKLKHYNSNNIIIPVIPSILRTNHLENLYKRMFNKSRHDDILKEIRKLLTSKKSGMYHDLVEGHRINHCVRSVIVPAPHLSPDTVELPLGCDIGKKYGLLNRQPSLGEGSIMSVKLVIGKNKTIGIHPSLCKSFNADFDGDEMCIYGLDELSNKLPIYENYTQDYLHTPNVNSFTYTGLTSTKEGIKYMVEKNIKGTNIDFKHIYDKIGDVIVNGKIIGHINNNYFNGLTQDEWYIQSKAGREGASSIGINTPFIGDLNSYVNRTLI